MPAIHAPKRTYTVRPYRFTLDPDHPLGQGLVFAGLGNVAGSGEYLDSSAYRNPCSLQSFRESHWVTALGRHGLEFNETPGEYVDNTSYFQGVNQAYTCCFWASITDVVTPDRDMIVETADTFALSVGWGNDGGSGRTNKFQAFVNDVGTRNVVSTTNPIAGQLYHVGVTFDGNKVRMHINGIFEAESTGDTTGDNPAGNGLHLGTYRNADGRWQNGMLLDVLVHHRVLPISEMAQLADPDNIMLSGLVREAPKPKTYFFPAEITPTLGYWVLDGPKQRRSVRPYRVKLNSDKQLSTGLVFAGLGSLAGGDVLVDSSPHSKDGVIDGQTWVTQFGRQGLQFPGTTSVVLPHRPALLPSNGMSWSWWQNLPYNVTTPIWSKKVDAINEEYDIQANASGVIFRLYGTPDIFQQTPGGTIANVWQHIVVTYDGSGDRDGMKIYIDGEDLSGFTGTDGAVVNNTGADVELGGDLGTFMEAGCRVLDPVIYDRALTSAEVVALGRSDPLLGGWIETERQDVVIPKQPAPLTGVIIYPSVTKRRYTVRPHRFKLDENHPLAEGLVFAGLGNVAGSESYFDSSVYENHSVIVGGASRVSSKLGRNLVALNGSTDFIEVPYKTYLDIGTVTVAGWMRAVSWQLDYHSFVWGLFAPGGNKNGLFAAKSAIAYPTWDHYPPSGGALKGPAPLSAGVWYHLAATQVNGDAKLCVNGVIVDSSGSQEIYTGNTPNIIRIGAGAYDWSSHFLNGAVSDVCVYDRALDLAEIRQLADPDNIMLSGLIQPITQQDFVYSPPAPPTEFKSTIFRSRLIRGTTCLSN